MTQVPADYLSTSSYNYDQPFSSVARTSTVTKVPPAKKITFFKSGDPQFAGVKMAINQRSFKSFNALMDDLSHRVPLPFGVRTITTPRGIHCISELDQLEDGGCYLCSDKKYVKPISITSGVHRPVPPRNGRPSSTLRRVAQEGKLEDYSTPFTHHGPRIPKKITLVKNGESGFRRSIILNRRNARSFKTLLDEISEILQFPVKKLYTVDGKKIDSMQALLHCPSTLVCVGREPFKPVSMENLRKHSVEKLPDLAPRSNGNNVNENNEMNFGLKAKKSVIHPRTSSSNRSMRFSLSSEKSYPNGLAASPDNGGPFSNRCSHPKPGDLVHSLVNDDIEKRVHVNKDGSLSVEMKVRFRLLNDETLQWSTQIKKSNLMNQMPCEESGVEEDSGVDPIQKMNPEASSEADESLYPCDIDSYMSRLEESECDEAHCHSCGKKHQDYDIWKNPMHTSQREEPSVRSTWHTRSSCSSTSSRRRVVHKKMASVDSLRTTSSEEFSEHIVQESSSYSETIENRVAYRSIKKCVCRSDLSTAASNGEDQHEYTRTSTSNSQRPSSLGLVSHSSCENNLDIQDTPEDHEASKTNSQNEDDNCFEVSSVKCLNDDMEDAESSRCGSVLSRSSLQSRRSKKNVCEETSSVGRSMSSSSLQKANQEDNTRCSTPANSVHSKSSNCTTPRAKSEQDEHSDDNAVVSSFSSESCRKKEAEEVETEQENEINEVSSVSAKTKPSQSIRDESSEGEQCSSQGTHHSISRDRNSKSDSGEVAPCNASCSSRGSKKSKHSHVNLDARSEMSVSSLESTSNKKNSLHADDLRPSSKTSNYSKSSCEIKKKSIGDPTSHNSGSFHSNISSTSEAEAIAGYTEEKSLKSATNGYSESSKGSKKKSHREENSKPSSLCSSVSSPNGKAEEGHPKMNSESPSSRHGSVSESVCSKGDLSAENGISNGNPASVSSKSEGKDQRLFTEISQESNERCSQSNISQSSKSRPIKTRNLRVKMSNSSRASLSETLSVCSMHCPVPPKGKPHSKKIRPTVLKNSSISSIGTESVVAAGKEQKEAIDSSKATSYGSKSAATEVNDVKNKEVDDSCNRKDDEELEGTGTQEEGSDLMPSTLPNTTPEEVVQEWLSKIPSETLIMKYEMEDDVKEECIEATTEVSNCTNAEEISEDEKAEEKNVEEAENEAKDEVGKETAEVPAINEEPEECVNEEQISETVSEAAKADQAECSQSVASIQNNNKRDLPTSVQTSVQIMKALLSSKHETKFDRSNSLPEVSPTMGRKLSNSANILITCLASLQLLDEESEDPSDKPKHLSKSRYMELLNIFQALWLGCTAEKSGPSSGQEASEQAKTSSGIKAQKSVDYDFTPMSSSGVDVSSGSGGSAEETTAGAKNCTLMAQKTAEFQSAGQEENNTETGTELTEAEEQSKEVEQSSRPSTACSKSKSEEKAQSTKEESLIQEVEENEDNQCSNCENGKEEEEENANEENSKLAENGEQEDTEAENGEQEDTEAVNDELTKESLKEEADQLVTTDDTNVNDAGCGTELKAELEEQLEKESPNDPKPDVSMATKAGTSVVQQNSTDPDPIWVLRLLKKIEKEFMTHYVSAMNEFKVRWNLQNNQQMDEMIQELKEEVSKRIQKSIEKELRKIKSRAGRRIPRPPDEPLKRESTLQTEQRRRRLQTMHKKSLFSDKNGTQSRLDDTTDLSFDVEEYTALSGAFEASISKQMSEEEYCPCDSCVRKKLASKPPRNPVVATNAPVMKAFDLQKILRLKKDGEEACESEAVQENDEAQPTETEVEGNEEKEPELNKVDSQTLDGDEEGPQISENQNCEKDEVKDEEIKEENEEAEEGGEEIKEGEEEEKEEEEEKGEEEIMDAEEENEIKEDAEGETEVKDEEAEEEAAEETKEEEEIKEEGETKEDAEEETKEEEEVGEKEEETKEEEEEEAKEENEEVEEEEEKEEEKKEEEDMKEEEEGAEDEEEGVQEEEEETKEDEEDMKEEEETKDEEKETKDEEEETKDEEEETKDEEEGVQEEEEETKEDEQDMKEEEETKEEEGVQEEEEKAKEDEGDMEEEETKEEEEEAQEEEEETKEDEEAKEDEEETKEEEEETKEDEEAKEDEEETKEEEEEAQEEEEETKEDEEAKEDEEETKEEEEETKEDEEAKEDEEETKQEEKEMEEEEENPNEEEEEEKDEKEGEKDEAETKEEEEEANEEDEETQNEEHEDEEASQAGEEADNEAEEADNEAEEAQEVDDGDIGAEDEKETSECREHADGSGTDNSPEGDAAEGEEAEQDENEAVEDANPESEKEVCSPEEANIEGGDKHDENDEEPTSDDPEKAEEKDKVKGNKISGKASKAKAHKISKRLETLNKAAAISCYSSVGNFSQQSQKGSEDESEEECKDDNEPVNSHPNGQVQSDESSKPSQMYPDSEEEEEDKASSCTDPLGDEDQAAAEEADPKEAEHAEEVQASKKKEASDEIDQDDLDF